MSPADLRQFLLKGGGQEVDPFKIGAVLRDAWKARNEKAGETRMRVCTHNLLLVASSPEAATRLSQNLHDLANVYPGRIVVVVLDDGPEAIHGWFQLEEPGDRPSHLMGEVVLLHVPNSQAASVHSLLTPIWQDGVPIFLWWIGQPPYEADWFETLVETSTRVIVDSGGFTSSASSAEEAGKLLKGLSRFVFDRYHQDQTFSDLTWGRLLLWREWVASLFDPPVHRELLQRLDTVRIDCWAAEGAPTISLLALYTTGWMLHLLHWTVEKPLRLEGGEFVCDVSSGGRPIEIRFGSRASAEEDLQRRLVGIAFEGQDADGKAFHLSVERTLDQLFTLTRRCSLEGQPCAVHSLQHKRLSSMELVGQELETYGHDRVFEGALTATLAIVGLRQAVTA